jgi:phenylacetic acid degradation operon negative regulatory protein
MVVLPPPAADRSALRDLLRLEGFGELDGATHVHPTVTAAETRAYLAGHGVHHALIFESTLVAGTDAAGLIARGWNLSELGDRYRRFQLNYAAVDRALATGGPTTALEAFVIRTLLIHDYRRIHLRDPELPTALLPPDWEGHLAYARCRTIYPYVWAGSEQHLDAIARRLDGPLPVADASSLNRFPAL